MQADFRHLFGISRQDDNVKHARIESGRDGICEERVTVKNAGVLSRYPLRARAGRNEAYD